MAGFRGRYRPSGRIDLPRFAAFGAGVAGAAAACAWLLWLGFEHRFYAPLLFALGAAMVVGGLALLAVRLGHCRSPAAALLLGLISGLVVQPGHHLLPYLLDLGPGETAEPADFVRHLDRRLSSVGIEWAAPPRLDDGEEVEPSRADYLFLWASTVLEVLFVPLLCGLPPLLRVLRDPYCETGGGWARRSRLAFAPAAEAVLLRALDEGRIAEVAAEMLTEHHPNQPALLGQLDVCSAPGLDGVAGYLSLRLSRGAPAGAAAVEPLFPYHRLRVRCAALSAREVAELQALAPERATARVAASWADSVFDDLSPNRELARLDAIDQPSPPPAADSRTRRIAELLSLVPLLVCSAAGIGLLFSAVELEDTDGRLATVLGISGFAVMLPGLWIALMDLSYLGDRYLLSRLARRLAQRPGLLVRPGDGDALAVALVPRGAWSGGANELIDHGLLAVRDAILYEGDRHRIRIPAASIHSLYVESLTLDQYQTWHLSVLEIEAEDGLHTLPFVRIATPLGETLFRSRKRRARVVYERLLGYVEEHGTAWNVE